MKKLTLFILLLFSVSYLAACAPKTEEEQIATINKQIAPDGHLTKTHLYIHWPAVYTKARRNDPGGKEIVPAVTLKIPMEYLGQDLISFENAAKIDLHDSGKMVVKEPSAINYASRIKALLIQNHQITSIYIRLTPGAKPYVPMLPYKSDPPELAQKKAEHFLTSYAVHINRNLYADNDPRFGCIVTLCFVNFGLNERLVEIRGDGEGLDHPNKTRFDQSNQKSKAAQSKDLPKWHEKVDPTQVLVNTFILPEDSPEVKGMFPKPGRMCRGTRRIVRVLKTLTEK